MKDARLWLRLGDQGDYKDFDTPYDAGVEIGLVCTCNTAEVRFRDKGIEVDHFISDNYISLYWGDDDAQPANDANLNESDRLDLLVGIKEGLNQ
uniref:Uncharacterized protein n=1 Tax=viral metagenome TaxID=1070528 RepID=A0A6M3JGA9_9ZZZZ